MSDDREVQKVLRDAIAAMPATIESALSNPKANATDMLKWVGLAIRIFQGPTGRPITDNDLENKREAAKVLRAAVPSLEKIRDGHESVRLRGAAVKYLRYIASEIESDN
jgi:hypothetical protein